ncbi:MAG: hypothetical protein WCP28_12040 [Actinomycetes bacterium]
MALDMQEFQSGIEKAIAQAWVDDAYKSELISTPSAALSELGVTLPDSLTVEFYDGPEAALGDWSMDGHRDSGTMRIAIPAPPAGAMTEDQLAAVGGAGGSACCCTLTAFCA